MKEEWKSIIGYDDYIVSNYGNVKSLKFGKERLLKFDINVDGYHVVRLSKNNKKKPFRVHRLMAEMFIGNPDNLPVVNHKEEWSTVAENTQHAYDIGLISMDNHRKGRKRLMKPVLQLDKNTGEVITASNLTDRQLEN